MPNVGHKRILCSYAIQKLQDFKRGIDRLNLFFWHQNCCHVTVPTIARTNSFQEPVSKAEHACILETCIVKSSKLWRQRAKQPSGDQWFPYFNAQFAHNRGLWPLHSEGPKSNLRRLDRSVTRLPPPLPSLESMRVTVRWKTHATKFLSSPLFACAR